MPERDYGFVNKRRLDRIMATNPNGHWVLRDYDGEDWSPDSPEVQAWNDEYEDFEDTAKVHEATPGLITGDDQYPYRLILIEE